MGDKTSQVLVRVEEDTKEEWEEAANESGIGSLSKFVRHAVTNEINGGSDGSDGSTSVPDGLDDVPDRLERLEQRTERIVGQLDTLSGAVESMHSGGIEQSDIEETTVMSVLPGKHELIEVGGLKETDHGTVYETEQIDVAPTPRDVAEELDAPLGAVRRTLERLDLKSERVQSEEHAGKRRYWTDV